MAWRHRKGQFSDMFFRRFFKRLGRDFAAPAGVGEKPGNGALLRLHLRRKLDRSRQGAPH
jgi:hypothetical protein